MAASPKQTQVVPATPAVELADVTEKYEIFDDLQKGTGAFSRVVQGKNRATGQLVAVKIMERSVLTGKKAEMVAHEKEILRRTRHDAICNLIECITTPTQVFMIMELMEQDLFQYIVDRKKVAERETAIIMKQLMSAVAYLHENSVIHRDIKPENILITPKTIHIQLADFGLAKVVNEWDVKSTPCGTSFYIAPEIIRGIEQNGARPLMTTREAVKFVDIWSSGIVAFVMLAGRPPFYGQVKTSHERQALLAKIDRGLLFPDAQWAHISEEAKDFVYRLLVQEPKERMSASRSLHHPFLRRAEMPMNTDTMSVAQDSGLTRDMMAEVNATVRDAVISGDHEGDESSYNAQRVSAPIAAAKKPKMGGVPVKNVRI